MSENLQDIRDKYMSPGLRIALAVTGVGIFFDQITKSWAESRLDAGACSTSTDSCIDLIFGARFHLAYNKGAAFSSGESLGYLFGILALIMSVVLLYLAWKSTNKLNSILFGMVAGGALGNFADRAFRGDTSGFLDGGVVDFIDLGWWPIFNIADCLIVVGAIGLLLNSKESKPDDVTLAEEI